MPPVKDLTGQRFGKLLVIERVKNDASSHVRYLCKCDCGRTTTVRADGLTSGHSKSCGCNRDEARKGNEWNKKHGEYGTRLYFIWAAMKRRCYNKNATDFRNYGGRGIEICEEWRKDFKSFYEWSMLNGYKDNLTIERKDVNQSYSPNNCEWVTIKEQSRNKRNTYYITYNGETRSLCEWAEIIGIKYFTLWRRINRDHWSIEKAFNTPVKNERKSYD